MAGLTFKQVEFKNAFNALLEDGQLPPDKHAAAQKILEDAWVASEKVVKRYDKYVSDRLKYCKLLLGKMITISDAAAKSKTLSESDFQLCRKYRADIKAAVQDVEDTKSNMATTMPDNRENPHKNVGLDDAFVNKLDKRRKTWIATTNQCAATAVELGRIDVLANTQIKGLKAHGGQKGETPTSQIKKIIENKYMPVRDGVLTPGQVGQKGAAGLVEVGLLTNLESAARNIAALQIRSGKTPKKKIDGAEQTAKGGLTDKKIRSIVKDVHASWLKHYQSMESFNKFAGTIYKQLGQLGASKIDEFKPQYKDIKTDSEIASELVKTTNATYLKQKKQLAELK